MKRFLVSVPFSVHTWVEAEDENGLNEELVENAMLEEHGKYATIDLRHGGAFEVLDEEDA